MQPPPLVSIQISILFAGLFIFIIFLIIKIIRRRIRPNTSSFTVAFIAGVFFISSFTVAIGTLCNAIHYALYGIPYPGETLETIRLYMLYTIISIVISMGWAFVTTYSMIKRYLLKT